MTDFVNLKIKPAQSFEGAHRGSVCVFIGECSYVYGYLCLYCVSKKIKTQIAGGIETAIAKKLHKRWG